MRQIAKAPATIDTPRLHLRPPLIEDAPDIFHQYAQDQDVAKYLVWRPHESIEITREFLRRCLEVWDHGTAFPWVIMRKEDGRLLGMIELRINGHQANLGYVLARRYWGHGYALEATKAVVDWALGQSGIYRVWAVCDVENRASARVLEKAGMQCEGVLRRWLIHPNVSDEPRDCKCYAKVK